MLPKFQRDLAEKLGAKGIETLDAPISGSHPKVADRTITFMVGGKKDVFERVLPILEAARRERGAHGSERDGRHDEDRHEPVRELFGGAAGRGGPRRRARRVVARDDDEVPARGLGARRHAGSGGAEAHGVATSPREGRWRSSTRTWGWRSSSREENGVELQVVKAAREMFKRAYDAGWGKDDATRVIEVYEGKDRM